MAFVGVPPSHHWLIAPHMFWNARHLNDVYLGNGARRVDGVFIDDGPAQGRARYPDVPFSLVYDGTTNWSQFRVELWAWLEQYRRSLATA